MHIVFLLSVIFGGVIFLLSIPFSVLQLIQTIQLDLYYNLIAIAILSGIGLYFVIMYTITVLKYRDQLNFERVNRDRLLLETNVRPSENYAIKLMN